VELCTLQSARQPKLENGDLSVVTAVIQG